MSSNKKTWKDSLVGLFNLSPTLGMICVSKNVHLIMQHPSLGSVTEGPTDTSEILITMPRPEQELSIYIFLSIANTVDFMHSKWEGCIVINSLIFVVVSRNILYCLNLGKNYPWTANKKKDDHYLYFSWAWWFIKMEKKQCTRCKKNLEISFFNLRRG